VTGLSASRPAFAYIILESLAEVGAKVELPRDVSRLLAAQTMKGAASVVLETGDHPVLLKDWVTTPAGCTIDGILELEEGKLHVTLIKAVVKATRAPGSCRSSTNTAHDMAEVAMCRLLFDASRLCEAVAVKMDGSACRPAQFVHKSQSARGCLLVTSL